MRKKIISCLLALAMVLGVLQGTGVPVKADPGTESNTVKVNASYSGMKITDTEISQRIINTLDAMIEDEGGKVILGEEYADTMVYYICVEESIIDMQYDFSIEYNTESKICTIYCNMESDPDAFEKTLYTNVEGENIYSAITFCIYVELVFARDTDGLEKAYFSKGIDGTTYTLEDKFCPTENGEKPYRIPYGGTFASIDDPKFVCFPEITHNGKRYYSWYLDEVNYTSVDPVKVDDSTNFKNLYNRFSVSFDECAHNYPANTDTEHVIWTWGTAENGYNDTSVTIYCTDEGCTESIFIENTEDFPNSISIEKTDIVTTCTTDGKTIYTATAKYVENGTTYTYTSTKTVDGDKATGHKWSFDTSNDNAVWTSDPDGGYSKVSIKKSCTDASHDIEKDGAKEIAVEITDIAVDEIPATECEKTDKIQYTAKFDSAVDPDITTPFEITKNVEGEVLQHDWTFDTENVTWIGNDTDGYTEAAIKKICQNTEHGEDNGYTISSTNIETRTEDAKADGETTKTIYTATFDSDNDPDIDEVFSVELVVEGETLPHNWVFDIKEENVEWTGSDAEGYTKASITKTCSNQKHVDEESKTVNITVDVTKETVEAADGSGQTETHFKAVFDSETDPAITTPYTFEKVVKGEVKEEVHQHNWEYDTSNPELTQDTDGNYVITINKSCINTGHTGDNIAVTSKKVTVSTGAAITCGEKSKTIYTATFDSEADSDITEAFFVKKEVEGPELQHTWVFDGSSVVWTGTTVATIRIICTNIEHGNQENGTIINASQITSENIPATSCGNNNVTRYTAVFRSPSGTTYSTYRDVEGDVSKHLWTIDSVESDGSFDNKPTKVTIKLVCGKDNTHIENVELEITDTNISVSVNEATNEITYTYTFTTKNDNQSLTATETFVSHLDHKWDVTFNWVGIPGLTRNTNGEIDTSATQNANYITVVDGKITITSTNLNYLLMDTHVIAEATCKKGGEKKEITVSIENKLVGNQIQYTAKVTDPNGKEWKAYKSYNIKDGTIKDGPAGTSSVEGGDIVIIGLEETYPFTGSKIKPAITVMDGDVVLAQSTDYTVSYTGKNKIGEINKVEVKGKGNYAGKSATAKFKITDPRDAVDKDKLADKVSKVSVNNKKFTYNGRAQYPSEVTVTLKDKSTIVYKVDEDGNFTTESEKEVGLSFANNINKGTATVAAMGSDGKVKKASYTIAAAEIASAEFEISAVDWAVKAATPEIKATIKLGDEIVELVAGQDYKVSFKAKEAGEGKGTAKISGKGNFKGKHADVSYTVNPMEITENNIVVKAIAGKKAKDVKVIVNDAFGNALNKKFYTVEIQNAEGTALNKSDALTEEIKVVVKGANAAVKTGEDGVTIDVKPGGDIAKVKGAFKVDKNFFKTYTGEPITLDADDFVSGKINVGTLELGKDFRIVGYKNNIKKGTMTVTVQGDGEYSGTKTFKVKIKAKPLDKVAPEN